MALNMLIAVTLLNAPLGRSVSETTAQRRDDGAGWACVLCRLLDWLVEPEHCRLALLPEQTSAAASARAAVALGLFLLALGAGATLLLQLFT